MKKANIFLTIVTFSIGITIFYSLQENYNNNNYDIKKSYVLRSTLTVKDNIISGEIRNISNINAYSIVLHCNNKNTIETNIDIEAGMTKNIRVHNDDARGASSCNIFESDNEA